MPNLKNHKQLMQLCWKIMMAPENRWRTLLIMLLDGTNSAVRLGTPYSMSASLEALETGDNNALPKMITTVLLLTLGQLIPSIRASLADPLKFPLPRALATDVMDTYLCAPENKTPLGAVIPLVFGPYNTTAEIIPTVLEDLFTVAEMITAAVFIGYTLNLWFAVTLIAVAAISLAISMAYSEKVSAAFAQQMEIGRVAAGKLEGALERRRVGWIFNRNELDRATAAISEFEAGFIPARTIQDQVIIKQKMVITLGFAASLLWAAYQVTQGTYPSSLFLGLLFYLTQFIVPLTNLTQSVKPINTAAKQLGAIDQYLKEHPKKGDAPGSTAFMLAEDRRVSIKFNDVTYAYPGKPPIFKDLKCEMRPGLNVIVGENGSGKSTLTKFLFGLIDPSGGSITLNGRSLSECTSASVRAQIATVLQDGGIIRGTIRENLGYGLPDAAAITDAQIYAALARVGLEVWVRSLEKGLETEVGGLAEGASGGQFQKISIARALLKDAPILIFDEPETALDAATKAMIKEILRTEAAAGKTVIVVSHDSSADSLRASAENVITLAQVSTTAFASNAVRAAGTGVGEVVEVKVD